ncbi:MAG: hypothetical protein ACOC4I_02645 [Spirochaetota bacterium]
MSSVPTAPEISGKIHTNLQENQSYSGELSPAADAIEKSATDLRNEAVRLFARIDEFKLCGKNVSSRLKPVPDHRQTNIATDNPGVPISPEPESFHD